MDKVSASEAGDCGFESHLGLVLIGFKIVDDDYLKRRQPKRYQFFKLIPKIDIAFVTCNVSFLFIT